MHFAKKWEMRHWEFDIDRFFRLKKMKEFSNYQRTHDYCDKNMAEIKAKYPNHKQAFE